MTYIIREDGQRFVVPSYRDVLTAKKLILLEREIRTLSASYGEYIAVQKNALNKYEIAFSTDTGFLLGETVWSYFKRPKDMIYCEELPDTNEAILVIVKAGAVYLDGNFPLDSIVDELLIFQTQKNEFEIYIHGNVPISQTAEDGKFSLDPSTVKSFQVLSKPIFPSLPLISQFELLLVQRALKKLGIGGFPAGKLLLGIAVVAVVWAGWKYYSSYKEVLPEAIVKVSDPFQAYITQLRSPDPRLEIQNIQRKIIQLYTLPGWAPASITYEDGKLNASVKSLGARANTLFAWAQSKGAKILVKPDGFYLSYDMNALNRPNPKEIYNINYVIGSLIDRLSYVLPGNNLTIGTFVTSGKFMTSAVSIKFKDITPATLGLVGQQFNNLPLVLDKVTITVGGQGLSGSIELIALGN